MRTKIRLVVAMAGVAMLCAQASATTSTSVGTLDAKARPANVPHDYVVTPNGFFHPSCVIEIAQTDTLLASGDVAHPSGSVSHTAACAYPRYGAKGQVIGQVASPEFDGWIAASDSDPSVTPPSREMDGDFFVPSDPTTDVGQTLFYFPGLEDVPNTITILQPVLAWNGFGDHRWTMTDWNCCNSGNTFHGARIKVSTGDKIRGKMIGRHCTGDICTDWKIDSRDMNTGERTMFFTSGFGQSFNWYFGGVLEAYGVSNCTDFPSNGSIDFTRDVVYDMSHKVSTPTWGSFVSDGAPDCNFTVTSTKPTNTTISWSTN